MIDVMCTRLEYEHVSLGGPRLTGPELEEALDNQMGEVRPEDYVVLYLAGHGVLDVPGDDGSHYLMPSDANPARPQLTYLRTTDLVRLSVGHEGVRRLMIVLDTCYSGGGAADFMREAMPKMKEIRSEVDNADGSGLVIISSSLKSATATAGLFTHAFHAAVLEKMATGGARVIPIAEVLEAMKRNAGLKKAKALPRSFFSLTGSEPEFLRTPGIGRSPADIREDARQKMRDDIEILRDAAEDFVGRSKALRRLVQWLDDPDDSHTAVLVRGKIGAGKSAVLGALLGITDQAQRMALPAALTDEFPQPSRPIDVVIHLRTKPTGAIVGRIAGLLRPDIAEAEGETEASVEVLLDILRQRAPEHKPLTVLIDAIDEATRPQAVIEQVIAPLVTRGRGAIRLMLGARTNVARSIIDLLGTDAVLEIDLGHEYADPNAMRTLINQRLSRARWYDQVDPGRRTAIIDYLAERAERSFFVAGTVALTQAERPDAPDPDDEAWRANVPREAGAAVAEDFERHHFGANLLALLRPLAYAQGRGLPFQDVWPTLVHALAPDLDRSAVIDDLRTVIDDASSYLVRTEEASPRYTLEHSVFAEFLREGRHDREDQRHLSEALIKGVDRLPDGRRDWTAANPYVMQHLSSHAAAGELIDDLVLDPGFLVSAEPLALLEALGNVTSPDARAAADSFRRALPLLHNAVGAERISYLSLCAHELGATALTERITGEYEPMLTSDPDRSGVAPTWLPVWAAWRPNQPHLTLTGGEESLLAVHEAVADEEPRLISIDVTGTTNVWNPATGKSLVHARTPGAGAPRAVAFLPHAGRTMVVVADQNNTIWSWNPLDPAAESTRLYEHPGKVTALATWPAAEPLVFSAGDDETVTVWNLAREDEVESLPTLGTTVRAIAAAQIDNSLKLAAGGEGRSIIVWDLAGQDPGQDPVLIPRRFDTLTLAFAAMGPESYLLVGGKSHQIDVLAAHAWDVRVSLDAGGFELDYVQSIAVDGGAERVTIVAGGDDRIVRLWDLASLEHSHAPLVGHEATIAAVGWVTVDGRRCVISGGADGALRVWTAEDYPPAEDPFVGHSRVVRHAAVTVERAPEGTAHPGMDRNLLATVSEDQSVRIWDLDTGVPVCPPLTGHRDWVGGVAFAHVEERTLVVSVGGDGKVRLWNVATGLPDGEPLEGHVGWIGTVAVAQRNGDPVALTAGRDGRVLIWNLRTREGPTVLTVPEPQPKPPAWKPAPLRALAIAGPEDALMVLAGGDSGLIHQWFLPSGTALNKRQHGCPIRALTVLAMNDGQVAASAGDDGIVRMWNADTLLPAGGTLPHHEEGEEAVTVMALTAASLADRPVVLSGGNDACVRAWYADTGEPAGEVFREHHRTVRALAVYRPDGDESGVRVVSGGGDGALHLFSLGESVPVSHSRPRHAGAVHALAGVDVRSSDNKKSWHVLVSGSADRSIRLWRWDHGRGEAIGEPLLGHQQAVRSVAVKRTGSDVLIVSGGDDDTVRVWKVDGTGGDLLWQDALTGHSHHISAVALDRSEAEFTYLASGDGAGSVRQWRITAEAGAEPPLPGDATKQVRALAIDLLLKKTTVFAGDADGVRAWHLNPVRAVRPLWTGELASGVSALLTTRLGTWEIVLTADDDARVRVRDRRTGQVLGASLPVLGPSVQALAAVRKGSYLRVALAVGDRLQIATLAGARGKETVTWSDEVTLSLGSKALSLAWIDDRSLAVGCEMGLVALELRDVTAGG
jgi:WD40 repeat protein